MPFLFTTYFPDSSWVFKTKTTFFCLFVASFAEKKKLSAALGEFLKDDELRNMQAQN